VFLRPWYAESRASAKRRLQRIRPRFLFFSATRFGTRDVLRQRPVPFEF